MFFGSIPVRRLTACTAQRGILSTLLPFVVAPTAYANCHGHRLGSYWHRLIYTLASVTLASDDCDFVRPFTHQKLGCIYWQACQDAYMARRSATQAKHFTSEWRVARARKAALARWGDPSSRILRDFLQALAASYCDEFASMPEVLIGLVTPLTEWSTLLDAKVVPEVQTQILMEDGNA